MSRAPDASMRVSTFELFFDLVFVLTITRVDAALEHELNFVGLAAMFLILANIWWMYAGYSWLTSRADTSGLGRRLLLFVAMGGFLVMALATPQAFGEDGLLFGVAYLVVVVVHLGLFGTVFDEHGVRRALREVAPYNLASAAILIIAGFVEGALDWWLWAAAAALHVAQLELGRIGEFPLQPAHFVERHGVVLIVALGESMVALGVGIGDQLLTAPLVLAGLLTLALAAALWALYFVDTDEASRHALEAAPSERVIRIAGLAFAYSFVPILGGILMISTGLSEVLEDPLGPLSPASAAVLAGGAAVYAVGVTALRQAIDAAGVRMWLAALVTAAVCAGIFWLGSSVSALLEVALLAVTLLALTAFARGDPSSPKAHRRKVMPRMRAASRPPLVDLAAVLGAE